MPARTATPRSEELHRTATIIDLRDPTFLMYRLTLEEKPTYVSDLMAGGLTAASVDAIWIDDGFKDAAISIAAWRRRILADPRCRVALTAADIARAKAEGQLAFILSAQSPNALEGRLDLVEPLFLLGLRIVQLTYQHRTLAGDGCGEKTDGGLSRFGEALVAEMCRVGMVVDLSHAGDRTVIDAAHVATKPVILSHTNARAFVNSKRNGSDEMFKAVAATGGVIGVSAFSSLIVPQGGEHGTTVGQMLDHIDYLCDLVGDNHVSIGTDVGEGRSEHEVHLLHTLIPGLGPGPRHRYVSELRSRANFQALTTAMVDRGYAEARIRKVLGLNFLRVFEQVVGS